MKLVDLPVDRVIALPGTEADALALAIARHHPGVAPLVNRRPDRLAAPRDFVDAAVTELERAAVELLPAWLPEAADLDRPDLGGLAALRLVTADRARRGRFPVRWLTGLAVLALTGRRPAEAAFPVRVRAAGLTRLVATAFGRQRLVLLVDLAGVGAAERPAVVAGAQWLTQHGGPAVWLLGEPGAGLDTVPAITVTVPPARVGDTRDVIGRPHPASRAEAVLEAALAAEPWAAGRRWNQSHQSGPLTAPVRLDLLWPAERCVVEIDGPEHCHPEHYENDRRRDVQLQLDGYAVLRFTNARVLHDVGAVVHQIGTFLQGRRTAEGRDHGRR